jgi:hypothetical protein
MRRRLVCAVAVAAVVVACSEPPAKEHDQALKAIEAARVAGAGTYATADMRTAETALAGYETAVGQRDYRLALSLAIDARESAYTAARRAAEEKARAKSGAEALQKARSRMLAEDYHGVVTVLTPVREALDGAAAPPAPARGRAGR